MARIKWRRCRGSNPGHPRDRWEYFLARISTLARKVEELEGKQLHEVHAVTENPAQSNSCTNFQSPIHPAEQCPMAHSVKDLMSECANTIGQYKPQQPNAPYGNTYNSN